MIKNKSVYIIVFLLVLIILLTYVFLTFKGGGKTSGPGPTNIPGVIDTETPNRPVEGKNYQTITNDDKKKLDQDYLVGQLIKKMPYAQNEFSLNYAISSNEFILIIRKQQRDEAFKALRQFLLENNIQDEKWLYNLQIEEY